MYLKKSINNIELVLAAKIKIKIKIMNVLLIELLGHIAIIHQKKIHIAYAMYVFIT